MRRFKVSYLSRVTSIPNFHFFSLVLFMLWIQSFDSLDRTGKPLATYLLRMVPLWMWRDFEVSQWRSEKANALALALVAGPGFEPGTFGL